MGNSTLMGDIPPPPAGFTADDIPPPPEGFTASADEIPPPPDGFTQDQPAMPGVGEALVQGLKAGANQMRQTEQTLGANVQVPATPESPAAAPFGMEDLKHPLASGLPKFAYKMAESHPMLAGGIAGGVAGELAAPEIPGIGLVTGALGAAGGAAYQTLGPKYQEELAKTPNDPDGAYNRAIKSAANSGFFAGLGWALFPAEILNGPLKNAVMQTAVVQPSVAGAQQGVQNYIDGQPLGQGVGEAFKEGAVMGAAPLAAAHGAQTAVVAGARVVSNRFFEPKGVDRPVSASDLPDIPPPPPPPGFTEDAPTPAAPDQLSRKAAPDDNEAVRLRQRIYDAQLRVKSATGADLEDAQRGLAVARLAEKQYFDKQKQMAPENPLDQTGVTAPEVPPQPSQEEAFQSAEAARRAAKFQGNKIIPTNDTTPPLTEADRGYNNALLDQQKPMQAFRDSVMGPARSGEDNINPPDVPPVHDTAETGPIFGQIIADIRRQILGDQNDYRDQANTLDASTPRYTLDNGRDYHLYNANDLEHALSLGGNLERAPQIHEVDLQSLDQNKITAHPYDLPLDANDPRIKLGQVKAEDYVNMAQAMDTHPAEAFTLYRKMVDEQGLRVVPRPGSTFVYGGKYDAKPYDGIPQSSRSTYFMGIDQHGEHVLSQYPAGNDIRGQSTVDMNKIDMSNLISADPKAYYRVSGEPEQREMWLKAAKAGDTKTLRELAQDGVFARAHKALGKNGWNDDVILPMKPLKPDEVIPGYAGIHPLDRELAPGSLGPITGGTEKIELRTPNDRVATITWLHRELPRAKAVAEILQEMKPVVDDILGNFGAKNRIKFIVEVGSNKSPGINVSRGEMVFPANYMDTSSVKFFGDLKQQVTQIVLHELGHLVSYRSWLKTPHDIKQMIQQAYQRAMLRYNLTGEGATQNAIMQNPRNVDEHYYLTFPEWHAEQFRRWANQDQKVLSYIDQHMKDGAKSLADLQKEVNAKMGDRFQKQMFQADYSFHSWMDYIEYAAHEGDSPLQFQRHVDALAYERPELGDLQDAWDAAQQALDSVQHMFRDDYSVQLSPEERAGPGGIDLGSINKDAKTIRLMVGSLAWVASRANMLLSAQGTLVHEAWHSIEDYIGSGATALLVKTAKAEKVLSPQLARGYYKYYLDFFKKNYDSATALRLAREYTDKEHVAALVERHYYGHKFDEATTGILSKISDFFERIGNMLRGHGFNKAEDILHSFYKGEITRRLNKAEENSKYGGFKPFQKAQAEVLKSLDKVKTKLGETLHVSVQKEPKFGETYYAFHDSTGKGIAYTMVDSKGEIQMIRVAERKWWGKGVPAAMIEHIEKVQGPLKTAQILTEQGYKMISRVAPDRVKYYVHDHDMWHSPKSIWEAVDRNTRDLATVEDQYKPLVRDNLAHWTELAKQIPDVAKDDPILAKQWSSRSWMMNEWEKDAQVRNNKNQFQVTGDAQGLPLMDPYDEALRQEKMRIAASNPEGAVPQPEMHSIKRILGRIGERDPETNRRLHGLSTLADKMSMVSKWWLTIRQLAWKNPHIEPLRDYISLRDQQNQRTMFWIARADETSRIWDNLPDRQRDNVSELLFWATEMRYRTPAEVRGKISRLPTQAEVLAEARRLGMDQNSLRLYSRIGKDFTDFLASMENIFAQQITRRISDPVERANQLAKLTADMNALRKKPYFPMVRFGKYALTGRDPNTGAVRYFSLHATPQERDAAVPHVHRQFGGLIDLSVARTPDHALDFMGLPGPLLQRIKDNMPGLNASQVDWLERFSQLMAPEQSFKKRWLARKGLPGYSLDGVRSYAQYFRSGSRYLARIEFMDQINGTMNALDATVKRARDGTKRQMIASMVRDHAKWMDTPGQDWTRFKALVTHFQLGFSTAAALMNLTQVPVVTGPYLSSIFGKAAVPLGAKIAAAGKRTLFTRSQIADPILAAAHAEMVRQGRIDIGQASELGSFAETSRMDQSYLGSKAQKAIRNLAWLSMWQFGKSERFNREWTFETAFKLALNDLNNPHVINLATIKHRDLVDVMSRTGFTFDQAAAFLVAREAIDRTQGIYQSWDRPKFLQSKLGGASRIFFSYTQQLIFMMANNPGRLKMMLMMGVLYGASGLPGAQDLDALVHLIATKVFGKDFNLQKAAREFIRDLTKGTFLDEVGPDLFLHGASRYSFGAGLLPEFMGMPQFDASSNGSMGKLVPGLADLLNGVATSGADPDHWKDVSAQVMQDIGGPGLGLFFPFMQYMNAAPYGADQKKWESILPRAAKAWAKAYHMIVDGGLQNRGGATIAHFDMRDPEDRSTAVMQALGFTPRVVNELYEKRSQDNNTDTFYRAQKLDLTVQMFKALERKSPEDVAQVSAAIRDYNTQVRKDGRPEYALSAQSLQQGIKARMKNNAKTERGLPLTKQQIPLQRETMDQYPGLIESKNVK